MKEIFKIDRKEKSELEEFSVRLKKSMNSQDYVSFDDSKQGLKYLNDEKSHAGLLK
ncbi:hypothetical protein [Apilactobacillus micheneri]|uniref:hypothetical protein n=1 Tax=Apilactobacillus micheneri TaxID=1899430 RepID=UPI000D50867A|nr:hypothetical protein [Apilactobacillus micheneri]GAY79494.1 hypothetical protein NBRC113063_00329 [Apilactobacillus micheneri]